MKALLVKDRKWVDIDTEYIFNDQYNTADGRRIFDTQIIRFYEDIRIQNPEMCKCGYCGKIFMTNEDYARHIEEEKSLVKKGCSSCFWSRVKIEKETLEEDITDTRKASKENVTCYGDTWENTHTERRRIREICTAVCEHEKEYHCCTHTEHAEYAEKHREYFKNTYFVLRPYGNLFDGFNFDDTFEFSCKGNGKKNFKLILDKDTLDFHVIGTYRRKVFVDTVVSFKSKKLGYFDMSEVLKKNGVSGFVSCRVENFADDKARHFRYMAESYNKRVTDDFLYTQPDGTVLTEVVIDGKTVARPAPVSFAWMEKLKEE